uniref:Ig-like domain-containing protein n=1 Tax=Cyclopterus lumpus TaxID=8103 RepID=A0A8C2WFP1_CYCLU
MGKFEVLSNGTLSIQNANIKDRGQYLCLANNDHGSDKLIVTLSVVAYPSRILEPKMRDIKSHTGNNVEMTCKAEGRPTPMISWILANQTQFRGQNTDKGRVSVSAVGTLVIEQVSVYDRGHYKCIASNPAGADTATVRLQVVAPPPGIVEEKKQQVKVGVNQNLWLPCTGQGSPQPTIHWVLHDGSMLRHNRPASDTRILVYGNGTLHIKDVTPEDSGKYECIATSLTGSERMVVTVSMKPAKIEPKLYGKKQVPYGNDFKVDCKASGAPKPEISWGLPDGTVVNSALQSDVSSGGGRARRYTLFDNGTLHLNQVGMSEEGDYTCYAENQVGKDEMHFHITVVTAAARIRPTSQTYARVKPGGNVRFDCEALGEPKPKILWMLPTNDVIAASNERYLMHVNGSLDIRDVKLIDAGEYVCMARNPAGESRKVFKLDIEGNPPVINGYRQNRTVIKDVAPKYSRKLIDCNAEGNPTPTITWIIAVLFSHLMSLLYFSYYSLKQILVCIFAVQFIGH